jgi:hypothetical protein
MTTGRRRIALVTMVVVGSAGCSLVEAGILNSASSGSRADASADAADAGHAGDADAGDAGDSGPIDASMCEQPEGGSPCDPLHIDCPSMGFQTCQVAAGLECCLNALMYSCVLADASPNCSGGTRACDETSDCPMGEQCWGKVNTGGDRYDTVCSNVQPAMFQFQLCKSNSDCPGNDCTVQQCSGLALSGQIETCGSIVMMQPSCM